MSTVLDVAIGLVVVYSLFAVVCSAINELLAGLYGMRSEMLKRGLGALLQGSKAADVLQHELITGLNAGSSLSYMPAHVFVSALLDRLTHGSASDGTGADGLARLRAQLAGDPWASRVLLPQLDDTVADVKDARARLERWFDDAMTRLSGQYKRHTQRNIILIALTVCGVCNVDSFAIARSLYRDAPQRATLVAAADRVRQTPYASARSNDPAADPELRRAVGDLNKAIEEVKPLDLPLGWNAPPQGTGWISKLLGLLFSVVAVSLGAPFWFDLMNKVANLRAAGAQPPRSDAQSKP